MRIKTYFSETVEAALSLASRELGGDALLLAARAAGESARHLGAYEVVFGVPGTVPGRNSLQEFLRDQDCDAAIAGRVLRALGGRDATDSEVWAVLRDCLHFHSWDPTQTCRLAFVGPAGGGKTSTALKVAFQRTGAVHLVDADTRKIGSSLQRAAALGGLDCSSVTEPGQLAAFTQGHPGETLLIDLEGFPPGDPRAPLWAEAVRRLPEVAVCLVLPATLRTADLLLAVERFLVFEPSRLIFSHMDETCRAGGLLSVAARGLTLFAFGTGPEILRDIEPSGERRILELLFQASLPHALAAGAGGGR
jgi:flagellar biosynthesis GTPase FlhF